MATALLRTSFASVEGETIDFQRNDERDGNEADEIENVDAEDDADQDTTPQDGEEQSSNVDAEDDADQETTPQDEEEQSSNITTNDQSNTQEEANLNDASTPKEELPQSEKSEDTSNNNNPSNTNDGGSPPADTTANPQPQPQTQPQPQPGALSNTNDGGSPPASTSTATAPPPPPPPQQTQSQPTPGSDTPAERRELQQGQGLRQREGPNNEKVEGLEEAPCRSQSGGGRLDLPTPEEDSISLNRAFKGSGCDVGKIVEILSNRGASHLELVKQHYKKTYEEELFDRLSSELSRLGKGDIKEKSGIDVAFSTTLSLKFSNDLKKALLLWILDGAERDAIIVRQGLSVVSIDLEAVTEVICSRTPSQLGSLKQAYFSLYSSQLLDDVKSNVPLMVSPTHKQLLIACLDNKRDKGTNVKNDKMVEEDAKQLYKDGEQIWGTNERTFIDIFTQRNGPHLAAVDAKYNELYGHSLERAVENETSRYLLKGLLTLLKCAKNSAKFFAEVLHEAVGTSNPKLIRVVVARADIDMEEIKKEYYLAYKVSLEDAIHKNTSGPCRTFLINLVNRSKGASAKRL